MINLTRLIAEGIDQTKLNLPQGDLTGDAGGTLEKVLRLVTGVIGAISFLVIVVAGLKYVLSRGNPEEISKAKDTILYGLAGLLISMAALGIITYVMTRLRP